MVESPCCAGSQLVRTQLRADTVLRCTSCRRDYGIQDARGRTIPLKQFAELPQVRLRF